MWSGLSAPSWCGCGPPRGVAVCVCKSDGVYLNEAESAQSAFYLIVYSVQFQPVVVSCVLEIAKINGAIEARVYNINYYCIYGIQYAAKVLCIGVNQIVINNI